MTAFGKRPFNVFIFIDHIPWATALLPTKRFSIGLIRDICAGFKGVVRNYSVWVVNRNC